jgi:amino acid adenylation domain-containing protein
MPQRGIELAEVQVQSLLSENRTSKFDLTLTVQETQEGLQGVLKYNVDLFEAETMSRLLGHWQTLLEGAVQAPGTPLSQLPLLTPEEKELLLRHWNATEADGVPERCVLQLFEQQVEQTPDAVALVSEEQMLTYASLNQHANQLAHYLQEQGVGPDVLVGLCLERSLAMVIGVLAVLKAAGAYLPLDPTWPHQRLATLLADAHPLVLLTHQETVLPAFAGTVFRVERDWEQVRRQANENPRHRSDPATLAYLIYTSGSTGQPKGVLVEQRQIYNYIQAMLQQVGLEQDRTFAMLQPLTVDSSATVLFASLCSGGCLQLISRADALDPQAMKNIFRQFPIDCLKIAPSHLAALHSSYKREPLLPRAHLIIGGEASRWHWVQSLAQASDTCTVINHYGPTETTVGVLTYRVERSVRERQTSLTPLGSPLANQHAYVLDAHMQLVPIGSTGELFLGGAGVTRGYLQRPDLTAASFVPHPFSSEAGARLYRTGDLVRYRADGMLEFLGRLDQQVKVRGYRIEPAEIEAVLLAHPLVGQAVVLTRGGSQEEEPPRLVAYVVVKPQEGKEPSRGELRQFVQKRLPDYLVPERFVVLAELPLTPHGKVDQRALLAYEERQEEQHIKQVVANQESRTAEEEILANIWADVLHKARVGIHENYFELGGNSLLTIQIITRAQMKKIHITVKDIFQYPTIAQLSEKGRIFKRDRSQAQLDDYQWSPISNVSFSGSPLVNLQPLGTRCPFFCVHAQDGDISYYRDLARYLGQEQAFYALQAPGLYGEQAPFTSVEELAAYYIEAIRTVQRHGPYLLGGWSFGSLVAFEMAWQLRAQGDLVADLILIDRPAPVSGKGVTSDDTELMIRVVKRLENYLGRYLSILEQDLQQMSAEEQVRFIVDRVGTIDGVPSDVLFQHIYARFNVLRAHAVAARRYVPQTYSGHVTNLCTEQQVLANDQDITLGWRNFVTGNIETHIVPGSHTTLIYEPHVQVLASVLKTCFNKIICY